MNTIYPIHYDLFLDINIADFTFQGKNVMTVVMKNKTSKVTIDSFKLEIYKCKININGTWKEIQYELDMEKQKLHLNFIEELDGEYQIKIKYKGEINKSMIGFYRSEFKHNGEEKFAAVTQFQENYARMAFPCFDEPKYKAAFDISYRIEKQYFAISNMPIIEEIEEEDKKIVKFDRTPIMSTYLVFFGVGDFEFIEDEVNGTILRLVASPGKASENGEFGLSFGKKTLQYCEDYYGIDYPLPKLDMIGTPAFGHGAMENWGAMLFREDLLLHFGEITSILKEIRIREVIAHEIAHQWFGNLVSPVSWKYIWLNESFANLFGFGVIDHFYPENKVWDNFIRDATAVALHSDARISTMPIENTGDEQVAMSVKNLNIIYDKGGSVLRMVKHYLGEENFKNGLNKYLTKFAYKNTVSDDLWESLEEASGQPIVDFMKSWVMQEGYPMVAVSRDGDTLNFSQKRFTYLKRENPSQWIIPISINLMKNNTKVGRVNYLMQEQSASLKLEQDFDSYYLNDNATGFFRTKYEKSHREKIGELLKGNNLSMIDRFTFFNDTLAMLIAGEITLDDYLDFLHYYDGEQTHLALNAISSSLRQLYNILKGESKEKLKAAGSAFCENSLNIIGYQPKDDEDDSIKIIRGGLIQNAVEFGSEKAIEYGLELFNKMKQDEKIPADLIYSVLAIGASKTNDYDWFMNKFENAKNEQEIINFGTNLFNFSDPELLENMKLKLFEIIPLRNRTGAIFTLMDNQVTKDTMWEWYIANLDNIEALFPFSQQYVASGIIQNSLKFEEDVRSFFADYEKKRPDLADSIEVGLENLEIRKQLINNNP